MHQNTSGLESQVAQAIRNTSHLVGHSLRYEAANGQVTLHGMVDSYFKKQMAQEAIRRIDGVQKISNLLEVSWSEPRTAQPPEFFI